jgi:hypothetical protein
MDGRDLTSELHAPEPSAYAGATNGFLAQLRGG